MKVCSKCKESQCTSGFSQDNKNKDGLDYRCKKCVINTNRTKEGKLKQIYNSQVKHSKTRKHEPPSYTKQEFIDRFINDLEYIEHHDVWVATDYMKEFSPSFDRKNDYKPYSFDNIKIMFWVVNNNKGYKDRKEGRNNKHSKAVIGTNTKTGEKIEFYSCMEAGRNGFQQSGVSRCCLNKQSYHKGYYWSFKE